MIVTLAAALGVLAIVCAGLLMLIASLDRRVRDLEGDDPVRIVHGARVGNVTPSRRVGS
jgi:hypothetical protein